VTQVAETGLLVTPCADTGRLVTLAYLQATGNTGRCARAVLQFDAVAGRFKVLPVTSGVTAFDAIPSENEVPDVPADSSSAD
jgi:hypothetical protein